MSENVNRRWAISVYKDEWDALLAERGAALDRARRAEETRENANAVSVRVELENRRLVAKRDALREAGEGLLRIVVDEYGDPAEDEDVADLSWLDAAVSAWRAATGEGGAASGQPAPPESQ